MAKEKTNNKKNGSKPNIRGFIERFIKEYCEYNESISDLGVEYGFLFHYPKVKTSHYPEGKPPEPTGRPYSLVKEKDVDYIKINTWAAFSYGHKSAFERLDEYKKRRLNHDLQKFFLLKELDFEIELNPLLSVFKYKISKYFFIQKPNLEAKEKLFNMILSLLTTMSYSFRILDETLLGFEGAYHHKSTNKVDSRRLYEKDGTYPASDF